MDSTIVSETPWETRNLGIPSYAVHAQELLENGDVKLKGELDRLRSAHESFFVFARITKEMLPLASVLGNQGFYLVECTLCPYIKLNTSELLLQFEKDRQAFLPAKYLDAKVSLITITDRNDLPAATIKDIAAESFTDDRMHMDHNCPTSLADRRFSLWVDDLIANGEVCFDLLLVKDVIAGFMARKKNNLVLAGFSNTYKRAGLGDYLWLGSCEKLKEDGVTAVETLISMNNVPVLNLYGRLGFKFKDTQYSFHLWHK